MGSQCPPPKHYMLITQSYRWKAGDFLSGFVGYTPKGTPFMHCGIGKFPSQHMAEIFLIALPELQNQRYSLRALITKVSPDNIFAIKLLVSSGFKSEFARVEFGEELNETRLAHDKLTQRIITIEGDRSHRACDDNA